MAARIWAASTLPEARRILKVRRALACIAKESDIASIKPKGVCAKRIDFSIDDAGLVRGVAFEQGCPGNALAVARLAEGQPAEELVSKLLDITCGRKKTSCPAQLAEGVASELLRLKEAERA
jgi:uncharacterized protein (TIGR03905 family)